MNLCLYLYLSLYIENFIIKWNTLLNLLATSTGRLYRNDNIDSQLCQPFPLLLCSLDVFTFILVWCHLFKTLSHLKKIIDCCLIEFWEFFKYILDRSPLSDKRFCRYFLHSVSSCNCHSQSKSFKSWDVQFINLFFLL